MINSSFALERNSLVLSNLKSIAIYFLVSLFLFFEMAVQVSPSIMTSQLITSLSLSVLSLGIMSGFYFYTYALMQIPAGFILDRMSPRLIITLSLIICSVGALLFSIATNVYIGSFARLLMGLGSAFAFISVLVVTADLFSSKHFASFVGLTQMLAALGAMSGQFPLEFLVASTDWKNTMVIIAIVGIILAMMVWLFVKYPEKKKVINRNYKFHSILPELKSILAKPQTWSIALYSCLMWAPMSGFASLWGVPFLNNAYHLSKNESALLCSFMWLGLAIASPIICVLSSVINNRVIPLILCALVGSFAFAMILEFHLSNIVLSICLFIAGAACTGQALSFAVVKEINLNNLKATALAVNNMAIVASGAIFQPLIGKVLANGSNAVYSVANYNKGICMILIAYIIAFVVALFFIAEPSRNFGKMNNRVKQS